MCIQSDTRVVLERTSSQQPMEADQDEQPETRISQITSL